MATSEIFDISNGNQQAFVKHMNDMENDQISRTDNF